MSRTAIRALTTALLVATAPGLAFADRIVIRGGGQIKGKLLTERDPDGRVKVLTERGKEPLVFDKAKIVSVTPEESPLDEYLPMRDRTSRTAQSQFDLGVWCEGHKLPDLARSHFLAAIKADDSFAPAHQKLGHTLYADRWLTGDELREAQGLVRHKGHWVTTDERDRQQKAKATSAEQASWVRKVRLYREAIVQGTEDRRREAEAQLMAIREPLAVPALVKVLGNDVPEFRALLVRVLGVIPASEASAALVAGFLNEESVDLRHTYLQEIGRRDDEEDCVKRFVRSLRDEEPAIVNRAAWALANLNALKTIPSLVAVLVQTKTRMFIPDQFPSAPSGNTNVGVSPGPIPPTATGYGTLSYYNGSSAVYQNYTVGPGVAAVGATSVPMVTPGTGAGLSTGMTTRSTTPRIVTYDVQNAEVLAALVKLTGKDYGYDVNSWKRWVKTSYHPTAPTRRVPQP